MSTDAGTIRATALNHLIVIVRDPHEHADVRPVFQIQHNPCALNRLPSRFQQEPLLRINVGRLPGRNPKKLRIELIYTINKPAPLGNRFPSQTRFGIIKSLDVPPVCGCFAHHVPAFRQKLPKRFCIVDAARKAAADTDNCDFLIFHTDY